MLATEEKQRSPQVLLPVKDAQDTFSVLDQCLSLNVISEGVSRSIKTSRDKHVVSGNLDKFHVFEELFARSVPMDRVASALGHHYKRNVLDLGSMQPDEGPVSESLSSWLVKKMAVIIARSSDLIVLAVPDALSTDEIDALKAITPFRVGCVLADYSKIREKILASQPAPVQIPVLTSVLFELETDPPLHLLPKAPAAVAEASKPSLAVSGVVSSKQSSKPNSLALVPKKDHARNTKIEPAYATVFDLAASKASEVEDKNSAAELDSKKLADTLTDFDFSSFALEMQMTQPPAEVEDLGDVDASPIVKFLESTLIQAYELGASDLHFEPFETAYRIRFRIDGELQEVSAPPNTIKEKLASRVKIISGMDISEKRIPQDGKMRMAMKDGMSIDFRVSTLPTLFGEKIVIRILDSSSAKLGIDALGYEEDEKKRLMDAIHLPFGMVLVTGPTGSGKTVSLYTCLNILNKPGVNISTAEDPSEINLFGINQVNVNDKAGLTFASALKSFLRQDPDILMVGEIRDLETADISIKAAQTGHLVLSTLHTNDAPATLTRLRNMGIQPFNIASSVVLITAQRLVKKLCPHCKAPHQIDDQKLLSAGFTEDDLNEGWKPYKAVGCSKCSNGYKGRVGLYQVMPISESIQALILKDASATEIAAQAEKEGVRTMRQSGLVKIKKGLTSLEQVVSAT